jgi:hypothetical protein
VKSIFQNKEKEWLVQIETKWCLDEPQATHLHKTHHDPNLEGASHSLPYVINNTML